MGEDCSTSLSSIQCRLVHTIESMANARPALGRRRGGGCQGVGRPRGQVAGWILAVDRGRRCQGDDSHFLTQL